MSGTTLDGNHTPGPWHWESDRVKNDVYGRTRYQVTALGKTITQVYHSSFEGGPTNAEADARLIAAAPELLEALEEILPWVDIEGLGAESELVRLVHAAIAAIAKAEGK